VVAGGLPDLFDHWDATSLKVAAPLEIVFVCGGTTDKSIPHDLTRRDALMSVCLVGDLSKYKFVKAEDVDNLAPRGYYKDFLSFELDIAQLSQIVLVFCESAGSFVELGAFCMESEIAHRTLVVIDDLKYEEDSFIKWGALAYLEGLYSRSSFCVLKTNEIGQGAGSRPDDIDRDQFAAVIASALRERARVARENQNFDETKSGHIIKLITGLIQDYGSLTSAEIKSIMEKIGHPLEDAVFDRYAQCAEVLGWIKKDPRILTDYYTATSEKDAIRFTFSSKPIDRSRWRADVLQYWKQHDPDRFRSIIANRRTR